MNLFKVVAVICIAVFSSQVFSSDSELTDEEYFYKQKQINYEKLVSSIVVNKGFAPLDGLSYAPDRHVEVSITLKEQIIDDEIKGKDGIDIYKTSPQKYQDILRKLTDIVNELPFNSYLNFKFEKGFVGLEMMVTKEALDYLNSRDDVFISKVAYLTH